MKSKKNLLKAQEWLERGKQASDPMDALANYWRGFNNLYFPVGKGSEREKISSFLRTSISESQASCLLSENFNGVKYLLAEPVIDMRGNGKDTSSNITAYAAAPSSLAKLEQLLMVIYQIRCNLEHGQKSPSRERDVLLCQSAGPIVAELLKHAA